MQSRWMAPSVAALAALALVACDDVGGGQQGELGVGTFFYLCQGDSDAQCDSEALVGEADASTGAFPPVALGADFQIGFESDETQGDEFIRVGSSRFLTAEDTVFTALDSGVVALVATNGVGQAFDLIHIRIEPPTALRISQTGSLAQTSERLEAGADFNLGGIIDVEVSVGTTVNVPARSFLRAAPLSSDGNVLAGATETSWTTSDSNIVSIVSDPSNNVIEIEATGTGTAELTVSMAGLTDSVTVTAGGAP